MKSVKKLKLFLKVLSVVTLGAIHQHGLAHHSFVAQYDAEKVADIKGYVTKVEWFNPHVYFYIDVDNAETGQTENWAIEMGPPHSLQSRGWKRNSMQIGNEVSVVGSLARDGSPTVNARTVTMASTGEVLGAASSERDGQ